MKIKSAGLDIVKFAVCYGKSKSNIFNSILSIGIVKYRILSKLKDNVLWLIEYWAGSSLCV